ncbi:hypothetical protein JOM56_001840 [Amanita muscaria]
METLKNVDHANVNNNDISSVGRDYHRNIINNNTYGPGNPESFTPKFLDLITPIDCESKHNHIKSSIRTHPTAGKWLLGSETYDTWKSGKSSTRLLWLNGIPGVGKTVICSRVIDDLRNKQDHPVIFFYCHDTSTRYDSKSILASLLRQLLNYTPPDSSKFFRIPKNYNETKLEDVHDPMLTDLLRKISFLYGKVFIVIDALDECSNLEAVLREFVILAKELCIFISSRDHAAIRVQFEHYEQIRIHEDDIAGDIRRYVTEEVTGINIRSDKLRKSVTEELVKGAQGSFLWPGCQAQQLRGAETDEEMEALLTTIPQGMRSAIVKSLKTIDSKKNSELLRSALQLVVCTPRPITLQALSEVMGALEMKDTWKPDITTRDPRDFIDDFAGLLICVSGKERIRYESCWSKEFSFDHFGDDDIVVPFHLCVKEYLLADPVMLPSDLKKYSLYPLKANDDSIAKICMVYRNLVLKHVWNLDLDLAHYPFAEYARERLLPLGENTGDSQKHGIVVSKKNFAIAFLIILMGCIFALMRPGLPSFPLLGHERLGSEQWGKTVSCRVVSERPRWFGMFGEPVPKLHCTTSSVVGSQTERKLIDVFRNFEEHNFLPRYTEKTTVGQQKKNKPVATLEQPASERKGGEDEGEDDDEDKDEDIESGTEDNGNDSGRVVDKSHEERKVWETKTVDGQVVLRRIVRI